MLYSLECRGKKQSVIGLVVVVALHCYYHGMNFQSSDITSAPDFCCQNAQGRDAPD